MRRLLLTILCAVPLVLNAQKHHEIGIMTGVSAYKGDLQPDWIPHSEKMIKPSAGILYKYFFNPHVGIRGSAQYLRLTAADSLSYIGANVARNLSFANDIVELQAGIELNLLPIDIEKFRVTPYIFGGIAGIYTNPYALDILKEKHFLRDLSTEGQGLDAYPDRQVYPVLSAAIPFGAGIKAFVGKTVMISAEVGLRYSFSDYLDDVSRSSPNMDTLKAYKGDKSVEMSYRGNEKYLWDTNYPEYTHQRGDFKKNDWYWTAGVTVTVYFDAFGNAKKWIESRCPRIFGY